MGGWGRDKLGVWDFLFACFFIEVQLIYNIMLVSGLQHSDSVIHIYIYIYSFSDSFPLYVITRY